MNIGLPELIILVVLLSYVPALVVAGMKERWVWFVLGLLFWLPSYVGALLPARPGSSWARREARRNAA